MVSTIKLSNVISYATSLESDGFKVCVHCVVVVVVDLMHCHDIMIK